MSEVTLILDRLQQGDGRAADELLPLVYSELRKLAAYKMAHEAPGHTLQPTALVHEAWLRLVGSDAPRYRDRTHFIRAAAEAMRRILIDNARRRLAEKRGGRLEQVPLDDIDVAVKADDSHLLRIDEAIDALAREDETSATLVRLRFFAGLNLDEAAQVLGVSERTAKRYWSYARAWLFHRLRTAS